MRWWMMHEGMISRKRRLLMWMLLEVMRIYWGVMHHIRWAPPIRGLNSVEGLGRMHWVEHPRILRADLGLVVLIEWNGV